MKKSKKLFPVSNISFSSNCEENAQQKTSLGCQRMAAHGPHMSDKGRGEKKIKARLFPRLGQLNINFNGLTLDRQKVLIGKMATLL